MEVLITPRPKPRVALLIHVMWPVQVPIFETVQRGVRQFVVFASVLKEPHRNWVFDMGSLRLVALRTVTIRGRWKHPSGFSDDHYLHLPVDTYARLSTYRPDVMISTQLGLRSLLAAAYRALHRNCRLILFLQLTEHQQMAAGAVRVAMRRLIFRYADWIIVNGQSARRYAKGLGFPVSRTTVVPTVCDLNAFQQTEPRQTWNSVRRLVFVGRLVEGKGLVPFVRTLDKVVSAHPDIIVEMNFVGYGPLSGEIAKIEVSDRLAVFVRGAVEWDERHTAYEWGQVFVFPSLSDDWGLVVNEAMASGLPICGSIYSQAVTELIEPGVCGWVFDPFDHSSMAGALEDMLLATEAQIIEMGGHARVKVSPLTPRAAGEQILDVITGVLS